MQMIRQGWIQTKWSAKRKSYIRFEDRKAGGRLEQREFYSKIRFCKAAPRAPPTLTFPFFPSSPSGSEGQLDSPINGTQFLVLFAFIAAHIPRTAELLEKPIITKRAISPSMNCNCLLRAISASLNLCRMPKREIRLRIKISHFSKIFIYFRY